MINTPENSPKNEVGYLEETAKSQREANMLVLKEFLNAILRLSTFSAGFGVSLVSLYLAIHERTPVPLLISAFGPLQLMKLAMTMPLPKESQKEAERLYKEAEAKKTDLQAKQQHASTQQ